MDSDTITEELQLGSAANSAGALKWVTGLYYMDDDANQDINPILASGTQSIFFSSHLKTTAAAAFAQGTYSLNDAFRVTLGGRYSWEKKEVSVDHTLLLFNAVNIQLAKATTSKTWTSFDPKIGFEWNVAPDVMMYLTYQEGFKSGGFNTLSTDPTTYEFQPEQITAYEMGAKSTLADGRLRMNGSVFYYDYKDIQESVDDASAVVISNAASAKVKGVDLDTTWLPLSMLELHFNAAYLDATFEEYNTVDPDNVAAGVQSLKGNVLPRAPKFSYTASAKYTQSLGEAKDLSYFVEYARTDDVYHSVFNQKYIGQPAVGLLNAHINAETRDGRYSVSLWGKNLTDEVWMQTTIRNTAFVGAIEFPADRRTFGVTFGTHW